MKVSLQNLIFLNKICFTYNPLIVDFTSNERDLWVKIVVKKIKFSHTAFYTRVSRRGRIM
jgi:hypothetical protein